MNLLNNCILIRGLKISICSMNIKQFFWERKEILTYKYVLEPLKWLSQILWAMNNNSRLYNSKFGQWIQNYFSGKARQAWNFVKYLNQTFWAIECWYKALKCKVGSTNTIPIFRKSEANLQTFWRLSINIGLSYKLLLKSPKNLNQMFWATEC